MNGQIEWHDYFTKVAEKQAKQRRRRVLLERIDFKDLWPFLRLMVLLVVLIVLITEVRW